MYTDCQSGRTAAIARHVSFAHIICFFASKLKQNCLQVAIMINITRNLNDMLPAIYRAHEDCLDLGIIKQCLL